MLEEKDFQRKADGAFEELKRRLLTLGDAHRFDVEGESGKLEVIFEEPEEAKFVISPNAPVREIWISSLSKFQTGLVHHAIQLYSKRRRRSARGNEPRDFAAIGEQVTV